MSTEDPAKPGLIRTPPGLTVQVGDVELGSGMVLNLHPDDFFYGDDWTEQHGILLEITRVGEQHTFSGFVVIEGLQRIGSTTRARAIAVRVAALPASLVRSPERGEPRHGPATSFVRSATN